MFKELRLKKQFPRSIRAFVDQLDKRKRRKPAPTRLDLQRHRAARYLKNFVMESPEDDLATFNETPLRNVMLAHLKWSVQQAKRVEELLSESERAESDELKEKLVKQAEEIYRLIESEPVIQSEVEGLGDGDEWNDWNDSRQLSVKFQSPQT
jgi:DNA-directed RNA polymerase specialized sigma24 family protein